jgi:hypothetical protein
MQANKFLIDLHTGRPLTQSDYTRSCVNTIVLLRMSTELLKHVEDLNKHIEEIVRQVGHLPELNQRDNFIYFKCTHNLQNRTSTHHTDIDSTF